MEQTPAPQRTSRTLARQCTAHARSGKQCGNPAIAGGNVCRMHGGGAPQVKRRAQLRLLELVDPAIAVLAREMVKAPSSADRQRAANSILDRAGVPRRTEVVDADAARDLLMARIQKLRAEAGLPKKDTPLPAELSAEMIESARRTVGTDIPGEVLI